MNPRLRRGEWDSNPRVLANMGLAIPRPTRLGDPRFTIIFCHGYINYLQSKLDLEDGIIHILINLVVLICFKNGLLIKI